MKIYSFHLENAPTSREGLAARGGSAQRLLIAGNEDQGPLRGLGGCSPLFALDPSTRAAGGGARRAYKEAIWELECARLSRRPAEGSVLVTRVTAAPLALWGELLEASPPHLSPGAPFL